MKAPVKEEEKAPVKEEEKTPVILEEKKQEEQKPEQVQLPGDSTAKDNNEEMTETLISPVEKLMQMGEGRTAEPLEGTVFNSFLGWIRVMVITISTLGLFYALYKAFNDESQN